MDREKIEKYITMDSTVREGTESKHPFREIIFLKTYQHISNNKKTPNVQLIWNSINILEIEDENLTIPLHRMFSPTCLQILLVDVVCPQE